MGPTEIRFRALADGAITPEEFLDLDNIDVSANRVEASTGVPGHRLGYSLILSTGELTRRLLAGSEKRLLEGVGHDEEPRGAITMTERDGVKP